MKLHIDVRRNGYICELSDIAVQKMILVPNILQNVKWLNKSFNVYGINDHMIVAQQSFGMMRTKI